ncbi:hypothetical protein NPIL_179301 [Nephila pilipes]|uniref:Uncharacterized protein n=1 Tax=Nephila pilipes TaxID=299642 RepID=A0A8X6NDC1_NEPPI|nr:hypothetical protein NPIL_179301 [Nephila pilipes]
MSPLLSSPKLESTQKEKGSTFGGNPIQLGIDFGTQSSVFPSIWGSLWNVVYWFATSSSAPTSLSSAISLTVLPGRTDRN